MLKYQKGYIFNGYTFVVDKEDIHNATDDMFAAGTALLPVPDIITNADRIRAMSDEGLAEQFTLELIGAAPCKLFVSLPTGNEYVSKKLAKKETLDWLKQPAEDDKK